MMMKCFDLFVFAFVLVAFLVGCKNSPKAPASVAIIDSLESAPEKVAEVDTTLYGVAGDFGMSSFCLITDAGDTILVTRTSEDGKDGVIYGDAQPGDRFAMITTDRGEALLSAINISQLELHTKNFKILNGHLILHPDATPDTVQILKLSPTDFEYRSSEHDKTERKVE